MDATLFQYVQDAGPLTIVIIALLWDRQRMSAALNENTKVLTELKTIIIAARMGE